MNCNGTGALKFVTCNNVTIEGIDWEKCGTSNTSSTNSGIEFHNSSNVLITSCLLYNFKGQVVLLSNVSGDVHIHNCTFMYNSQYGGHGTAVYYLPWKQDDVIKKLVIEASNFTMNGQAQSVVYIGDCVNKCFVDVFLQDSVFINNQGVPLYHSGSHLHVCGSVLFNGNKANAGGGIYSANSTVSLCEGSNVQFVRDTVETNGGAICVNNSKVYFSTNSFVNFENNDAREKGGAIYSDTSDITFDGNSSVTFSDNEANDDGGAVYSEASSHITFDGNSSVTFNGNRANDNGGAVYCVDSSHITFDDNSSVTFNDNIANDGGAVYCVVSSHITFDDNSSVTFNDNIANDGGAVYCVVSSHITFDDNSSVTFNGNRAYDNGGAVYCVVSSHVTFDDNSSVTFNDNIANDGGAVYCVVSSHITFDDNSSVTFNGNRAYDNGGAVYCEASSHITFNSNSSVTFNGNRAYDNGGAVYSEFASHVTFDDNSSVTFNDNIANDGGAVYCVAASHITFNSNSSVTFNGNRANDNGGAVYCEDSSHVTFDGNSSVTFNGNRANDNGGAVYCGASSNVTFDDNSSVIFNNNEARYIGGAIYLDSSYIRFQGISTIKFNNNTATLNGGAIATLQHSSVTFTRHSVVVFYSNVASQDGAGVYSAFGSTCSFSENSCVTFHSNIAQQNGAAVYLFEKVVLTINGRSNITFNNNTAIYNGGVLYLASQSTAVFTGTSNTLFQYNRATLNGGVIYCSRQSKIHLNESTSINFMHNTAETGGACSILQSYMLCAGNSLVVIANNSADLGGALYASDSNVLFTGITSVKFTDNIADNGGAVYAVQSSLTFTENSSVNFTNNAVKESGGAMHISDNFSAIFQDKSQITWFHNTADRYGGAIYAELTHTSNSVITFLTTGINFSNNTALRGSDVYVDIPTSCNDTCLQNSIIGTNNYSFINSSLHRYIDTPPKILEFYNTTTCIENDTNKNCQTYLTRNIMLGQEIIIDACVLDYYDQPVDGTLFIINGKNGDHQLINGSSYVLVVTCEGFRGIRIIGEEVSDVVNYSITITSHDGSKSDLKTISMKLITELSPCHPGFHYDNDTQRCICYSDSDIVSCSGSTSSIKRGYWFGEIDDKTTVTVCPNNYCNFACCETINGFYELSPMRTDQCNLQRSGTACGSCEDGYTLSFDSVECVSVSQCTTGQTVLIVTLSIIYWIAIVVLVFIMTYYHVGIGYLYVITYYYSVVDILLSDTLYTTQGLFTAVSIMSSIAKVTPQFLGQLCLVQNMDGIDQQFIHYVHPLAVSIILSVICMSARISYRISAFVSRGIIHVICFLLLLSYTSVATTSLLLLRSLTFHNVDKVYTYLSPDIEYFHGRHLPYVIAAILCTLVIVVGLPLLLLLEPFLNHKINFTRIKPLLDQFQGCYKDKYRRFAAYYMSCRLVIILIVIANSSNDNTTQYLLITVNAIFSLFQVTIRPYASNLLNMFDGMILHLIIVVSMIPLVDNFDQDLLLSFIFITILLPLGAFLMMEIYLYKETIKKVTTTCMPPKPDTATDNNEIPMRDFVDSVVDDTSRRNAYICEM